MSFDFFFPIIGLWKMLNFSRGFLFWFSLLLQFLSLANAMGNFGKRERIKGQITERTFAD